MLLTVQRTVLTIMLRYYEIQSRIFFRKLRFYIYISEGFCENYIRTKITVMMPILNAIQRTGYNMHNALN